MWGQFLLQRPRARPCWNLGQFLLSHIGKKTSLFAPYKGWASGWRSVMNLKAKLLLWIYIVRYWWSVMNTSRWSRIILKMATGVVPATTPPMPKLILRNSQIINKITQVCQIFFMYLMLVLGGRIYTSLLYLAIVVVMVTLRLPLVMPHDQLFELDGFQ